MPKAIVVDQPGGPEVLQWREVDAAAEPGADQIRVRQRAVGLNFIDVYHRSGQYKVAARPFTPGVEAVGVVEALGPGVTGCQVGDRVAYSGVLGAYAEVRVMSARDVVPVPGGISDEDAAALMLKGMTAGILLRRMLPLGRGDRVLLHAAAGGVGLIVCQWARHLGIELIATAGGPEKCARALAAGASHAIDYSTEDFVARVKALTDGGGVKAVFDGVGRDTFLRSLDCIQPLGMMVSYGQTSGTIAPFDVLLLAAKGSLHLARPSIMTYQADRARHLEMARELFDVVQSGAVKANVRQRYPLAEASRAHADLEARRTVGATVLFP